MAISGQVLEEARVRRLDVMTELFVSFRKVEQLGILFGGIGQGTKRARVSGDKRWESEDRGVNCPEEGVKEKRLAEHVVGCQVTRKT